MARPRTPALPDPVAAFEDLRPYVVRLRDLQRRCKPFGPDYHALAIAIESLEDAAHHFTGRPHFYAAGGKHQ